ncbi:Transcriptional regulator, AcrR family [hydrothermal vent metagenome]|uniref:Transcriptional regulator, AcrR family n=1 Tax=hydrothermal vent metagenome TaxID=652676 RepID=A0A3B1DI55_9ZZZZ
MKAIQERGQKTKQRIISVALNLFHKQGTNATSVDEILKQSDAGKSQFYYYFKNKDDLIHEVVQNFYQKLKEEKIPVNYDIYSWEDLEKLFQFFINFQKSIGCSRGCPIATIAYELTSDQELIRKDVHLIFEFICNAFERFFSGLAAKGQLKKGASPEEMAGLCFVVAQGGMLTSKVNKETIIFERSVKHLLAYLKLFKK